MQGKNEAVPVNTIGASEGYMPVYDATNKKMKLVDPLTVQTKAGTGTGDFMADGSVPATGDFDMDGHTLVNVVDPTDDQAAATKKYVDDSIPTKAAGSDIDTATDDSKFATSKALKDSHNIPSVAPSTAGKMMISNGTDWTSSARYTAEYDNGNSGASKTIDWANGVYQKIAISETTTLTFTAPAYGVARLQLKCTNGGAFTVALPTYKSPGAEAFVMTSGNGKIDILNFYFDGTTYFLLPAQDFGTPA